MTIIVGHRAMGDKETELASFGEAIDSGVKMVEFDLRMTEDKKLVVYHGPPGMEGKNILRDKTLSEITKELGRRPPLFSEVLEITAGQIALDIEIKERDIVGAILSEMEGINRDSFVITSFLDEVVREVKEDREDVKAGLILGMHGIGLRERISEIFPGKRKRASGADFLVAERRIYQMSPRKEEFGGAFLWGVNREKDIERFLRDQRIAALITDYPKLALRLKQRLFVT